ncbi:hypothetical protein K470DRAFT_82741 [Piedraia hortae CBS 480.64]|uniref:Uncharacterized protein n=1 Tax=Piedraia hortae CBS 480.64 TaxID=1314780 RepID=A0A6A7C9B3_9PEZI|nr:hypothetical protein K470DRAFT_82741 [Piedraia hortae CBS 480.64]
MNSPEGMTDKDCKQQIIRGSTAPPTPLALRAQSSFDEPSPSAFDPPLTDATPTPPMEASPLVSSGAPQTPTFPPSSLSGSTHFSAEEMCGLPCPKSPTTTTSSSSPLIQLLTIQQCLKILLMAMWTHFPLFMEPLMRASASHLISVASSTNLSKPTLRRAVCCPAVARSDTATCRDGRPRGAISPALGLSRDGSKHPREDKSPAACGNNDGG